MGSGGMLAPANCKIDLRGRAVDFLGYGRHFWMREQVGLAVAKRAVCFRCDALRHSKFRIHHAAALLAGQATQLRCTTRWRIAGVTLHMLVPPALLATLSVCTLNPKP